MDSDSDTDSDRITESDDDESYEYVEESVIELDDDGEVREYTKMVRRPKAMSKEQRLALLFRPPFDLMTRPIWIVLRLKPERRTNGL